MTFCINDCDGSGQCLKLKQLLGLGWRHLDGLEHRGLSFRDGFEAARPHESVLFSVPVKCVAIFVAFSELGKKGALFPKRLHM